MALEHKLSMHLLKDLFFGSTLKNLTRKGPIRRSKGTSIRFTPLRRTSTFRSSCRNVKKLCPSPKWRSITRITWRLSRTLKSSSAMSVARQPTNGCFTFPYTTVRGLAPWFWKRTKFSPSLIKSSSVALAKIWTYHSSRCCKTLFESSDLNSGRSI